MVLAVAMLLATCSDSGPTGPLSLARAGFDMTGLVRAGTNLPIPIDSLRIRLRRSDNSLAYDRAIWVNAPAVRTNLDTIAITLDIPLHESPETFAFFVGAEGAGVTYYQVQGNVSVSAGGSTRTPDLTPTYVGPGALADSVSMTLTQPIVAGGDSIFASAQVWQGGAIIPGVPVGFTSSDTTKLNNFHPVGLDGAWVVAPPLLTDSVNIIAVSPTGLTAQSQLAFAPAPAQLVLVSGDGQSVPVGQVAGSPLVVQALNSAGLPFPLGQPVVFAVVPGSTGTSVLPLVDTTDAQGFAQTILTAGNTAGSVQVTATAVGLSGSPVTFGATLTSGTGGAPATIAIISGNNQTAPNGTALPAPLVVEVRDQAGVPLPGISVSWSVTQGSASPASGTTNAAGRAQTSWTLGTGSASQSLTVSVTGVTPAVFSATATFAAPAVLLSFPTIPGVGVGLSASVAVGLTSPAGAGGVTVNVTSQNTNVVQVPSPNVFIPQGQISGSVTINGIAVGTTTITGHVAAGGFTDGTLVVDVQNRNIAVPPTLNVPYGQTASLPIQLPSPAPAGGVTFTVATSDATTVGVLTTSVTIPAGGQTSNATLSGVLPGPATITVSNPAYITGISAVTTAAALNIQQFSATLNSSFGAQVDVDFTSNGQGIAAPAPGVTVTAVVSNPTCLAAAPVTIPTGLVSTPMVLTYAGTASLPCTSQFKVTAPNIQPDSINVTVNPQPGITVNTSTVGSGLQIGASGNLGASNHGGTTVTLTSGDPNLLLAPDANTVGSSTLNVFVPNNQTGFSYEVQALEGQTGTTPVTVTATATGFSGGSGTINLVQGAIDLIGVPPSTTTLSAISNIYARTGLPNSQTLPAFLIQLQEVRFGAPSPLTVTFADNDPNNASTLLAKGPVTADTLTAQIGVRGVNTPTDTTSGGVAFQPQATGTSTISASIPGFLQVTNTSAGVTVTITQPGITVNPSTVGSGLQVGASGNLGASNHGGVTVTLTSGNSNLLLAPDANTAGSSTLNVFVPNNQTGFSYVVQALEGQTGTTPVTVTATATGFSNGSGTINLVQGAIDLIGVPPSTTTLSAISNIYARTGLPNSQTTPAFLVQLQEVRFGGPGALTVTFTSQTPAVGDLLKAGPSFSGTQTAQIGVRGVNTPTDTTSGGVALHPVSAGTTVVSASIPGFLQVSSTSAGVTVTVTQPGITVNTSTVGSGLQVGASGNLGASNHGGVTVTLTSGNSNLLLAPDANTVGSSTLNVFVPNNQTGFSYVVQALEGQTGTTPVTVTATATGFSNGSGTINLVQGALDLIGVPTNTTTLSAISNIYARTGLPNSQTTPAFLVQLEEVRFGGPGPLTVTFTSQTPAVGDLLKAGPSFSGTQTAQIGVRGVNTPTDTTSGGVALHPVLAGTTVVSASIPGFLQVSSTSAGFTVTIIQPAITVNPSTVGSGLQVPAGGNLGAPNHGGTTVTLTSSNAALLLAPNGSTPGTSSINVFVPNGTTAFSFYVQGLEGQTDTVTAAITAVGSGFTNGNGTADVIPSAFDVIGLPPNPTAGAADSPFYIRTGIANTTGAFLVQLQAVRAGAPAPLTVTVSSNAPGIATLVSSAGTNSTQQVQIPVLQSNSPTSVAAGGLAVRPLAAGNVIITSLIPGYFGAASSVFGITVH